MYKTNNDPQEEVWKKYMELFHRSVAAEERTASSLYQIEIHLYHLAKLAKDEMKRKTEQEETL